MQKINAVRFLVSKFRSCSKIPNLFYDSIIHAYASDVFVLKIKFSLQEEIKVLPTHLNLAVFELFRVRHCKFVYCIKIDLKVLISINAKHGVHFDGE